MSLTVVHTFSVIYKASKRWLNCFIFYAKLGSALFICLCSKQNVLGLAKKFQGQDHKAKAKASRRKAKASRRKAKAKAIALWP